MLLPVSAGAVVFDVCATCTYTSVTAALGVATAVDVIELRGNISEKAVLNKNVAEIRADVPRLWQWTGL